MKEIPIIFSTPMVQAILDGRKTMTRRVVKHGHVFRFATGGNLNSDERREIYAEPFRWDESNSAHPPKDVLLSLCPYGKPRDVLWVRESFAYYRGFTEELQPNAPVIYKADKDNCGQYPCNLDGETVLVNRREKWKPSIHMPKSACRIFLEVVSVKVERLQEITVNDIVAEGIHLPNYADASIIDVHYPEPWEIFESLWNKINGPDSWEANPWVWVIEFKKIKP